ncbi:MAG: hypothetical protein ACK2T6_09175, partial [Anaerolineae bacterium]
MIAPKGGWYTLGIARCAGQRRNAGGGDMRRKGLSAIFGGVVVAAIGVMLALVSLAPAAAVGSDEARLASATFTVDSEVDAVDVEPGDGVCATAEGACSLRAAVMEANSLPGADHVVVPSGTYSVSIPTSAGVPDDPAASGDIDIIDELVITGAGSEETVLKGPGGERGWSVLNVSAGVSATLEALQVREGSGALGGGISNDGALTLRETAVVSNTSVLGGGLTSRGRLEVHGGRIALNVSESGGGVVFEPTEAGTEALFVDAEITGNGPAGVKCAGWGGVVLNDSRIVSNTIGVDSAECAVIAVGSRPYHPPDI